MTEKYNRTKRHLFLDRWLCFVIFLLFSLIILGGITRLTDSGLSITEWKPVHGIIPPLNETEWEIEFRKYQEIPEYKKINSDMDLQDFKYIFWWEWCHRALARLIGIAFGVPLLIFLFLGWFKHNTGIKLLSILILGMAQGAVGWWMVLSGLTIRTDVSQYRLAVHLLLGSLIFAALLAIRKELREDLTTKPIIDLKTRICGTILFLMVFLQIGLGALVAGLHAGLSYNHWPLIDGAVIPGDLFSMNPVWTNFFENTKTVQFNHRILAYVIFFTALFHMIWVRRNYPCTQQAHSSVLLFLMVTAQGATGILTLLTHVPFHLAIIHQAFGLVVIGAAAVHAKSLQNKKNKQ